MKLEPLFKSENNSLYFLDGTPVDVQNSISVAAAEIATLLKGDGASSKPFMVTVPWTLVGMAEDSYNEEFLAVFRDLLKALEETKNFAFIVPQADSPVDTDAKKEQLVASFKHCARRIKDCVSVIGFAVPDEADPSFFIEELSHKHAQYVFFSRNDSVLADGAVVRY